MTQPHLGFVFDTEGLDALVPSAAEMSVIGAVVTAPGKTSEIEYGKLYAITTDDTAFYTALGATGTARKTIDGVARQLGQLSRSARMVVVVVEEGDTPAETLAAVAGSAVEKTGVHAFKKAGQQVNVIPRIVIAPGFTSQIETNAILSATIGAGGTGYTVGNAVTATGGGGTGFAATVSSVNAGAITGIAITNRGSGYTSAPTIAVAGGTGATLTAVRGTLGNPVCAELESVCESLLAVAPVSGPATSKQAALDWRETLSSKRLIPTETDVMVTGADGNPIQVPADAYVAGLINRVDELNGGLPFHSAGNRSLYGVLGPNRTMDFSLTDGDTEGQQLLAEDIGIIVRGEGGDDFSIAEGGVIYLGTGTASNESAWKFYNQVRGRDWIHLTLLRTLRELLARYNITGRMVQVLVNTMRDLLARLAAEERIHRDFQVQIVPALNTPADLRQGQITIKMAVEEPSPFMRGIIKSNRYEFALTSFVEKLAAQVNEVAL